LTENSFCDEHAIVQTAVDIWAKLTKRWWLISLLLVGEHGSGQKYFFTGWYYLYWTVISFICLVVVKVSTDFISKWTGNECNGASFSIQPRRKTKPTDQSNDWFWSLTHWMFWVVGLCCCALCVHSVRNEQLYFSAKSANLRFVFRQ
jgi:hypothetical protein